MKILIWSPDNGDEDSADEKRIPDIAPEDLSWSLAFEAEAWLEKNHGSYDYCDELDVSIRLLDYPPTLVPTLWEYNVEVRMEPTFTAAQKKKP